jgi:hypothetical protein
MKPPIITLSPVSTRKRVEIFKAWAGVGVGVAVGEAVGLAVGVAVGVAVGLAVGVAVGVGLGVGVGVIPTTVRTKLWFAVGVTPLFAPIVKG